MLAIAQTDTSRRTSFHLIVISSFGLRRTALVPPGMAPATSMPHRTVLMNPKSQWQMSWYWLERDLTFLYPF